MCSTHNHDLQSSGMAMGRKGLTQVRLSRNDWARCSSATYRQHAHLPSEQLQVKVGICPYPKAPTELGEVLCH
jgi:hypothetical protein